MAGVFGAGLALAAVAVVFAFYGMRLTDHLLTLLGLMAAGFGFAVLVYGRLATMNRRAKETERAIIDSHERRRPRH